jgi:hypothetical protein
MSTVELILALEEEMELVPLCRKGWWVAFGAPRPRLAALSAGAEREAGPVPPADPRRRERRDPQPPTPRPAPDPAPAPDPPAPPEMPPGPRTHRGRR